jgi:hypothetical protein
MGRLSDHGRNHHGVRHAMEDFLVCGADRGEEPAQFGFSRMDEKIWAESRPSLHGKNLPGGAVVGLIRENRLPENLQDVRMMRIFIEGVVQ